MDQAEKQWNELCELGKNIGIITNTLNEFNFYDSMNLINCIQVNIMK